MLPVFLFWLSQFAIHWLLISSKRGFLNISETEIRCQESRNGGVAYEVILADPVVSTPPQPIAPPARRSPDTIVAEDIEEKLKAAKVQKRISKDN